MADWSCSVHVDDFSKNISLALPILAAAQLLGCRSIRTDVRWRDLEPARGAWDAGAADFYASFFDAVRAEGLQPLAILSGAPDWAKDLHAANDTEFLEAAGAYAARALPLAKAPRVQLWNELNHPTSHWLRGSACGLLNALGQAARVEGSELWVNVPAVMADDPLWERAVDAWLGCAGDVIDGIGVDHYPGTWSPGAWTDWRPLETLLARTGADWGGRKACVLETGFSSWSAARASEADQAAWVNESLPALLDIAPPGTLVNWYELLDGEADDGLPEESHFGVLRYGTLERKPAFAPLQRIMNAEALARTPSRS